MTQEEPDDMTRKPEGKLSLVTTAAESALIPAEDALDAAEQAIRPEPQASTQTGAGGAPMVAATEGAGLPSQFLDHSLNLVSDTLQPKYDLFKSWSDNVSVEIDERSKKFDAEELERDVAFQAEQTRLREAHDASIAGLTSLRDNVEVGLKVLTDALKNYTDLTRPTQENER